jgi:hypothetical protein
MASALISTQATILPFSSRLAALGFRGRKSRTILLNPGTREAGTLGGRPSEGRLGRGKMHRAVSDYRRSRLRAEGAGEQGKRMTACPRAMILAGRGKLTGL